MNYPDSQNDDIMFEKQDVGSSQSEEKSTELREESKTNNSGSQKDNETELETDDSQTREALIKTSREAKTNDNKDKVRDFEEFILTKNELKQRLIALNANLRESPDATNYTGIVKLIVFLSQDYLTEHRNNKSELRFEFVNFFKQVLGSQLVFLFFLMFFNGCCLNFSISDEVLIAFMASIFAETLGCIILMIKFAFKSDEEVKILEVLNKIVENFQK